MKRKTSETTTLVSYRTSDAKRQHLDVESQHLEVDIAGLFSAIKNFYSEHPYLSHSILLLSMVCRAGRAYFGGIFLYKQRIGKKDIRFPIIGGHSIHIVWFLILSIIFGVLVILPSVLTCEVSLMRWLQVPFFVEELNGRWFLHWGFGQRVAQRANRLAIHYKLFTKNYNEHKWDWFTDKQLKYR